MGRDCHGEDLGPQPRRFSPSGFFCLDYVVYFTGDMSLQTGFPLPLEWISLPLLVAGVLSTSKGAESPGSSRIGVRGAFFFFPSEAVGARSGGGL